MNSPGILTLTTDFGTEDSFAGQLHGAALAVDSSLRCVDLTHAVPPGDIAAGAYALETGIRPFPPGTVHVAVVDPGVGGSRRALLVEGTRHAYVGPDNGLLERALRHDPPRRWTALDAKRVSSAAPSPTFHGRDLFVPAAARYLLSRDASALGTELPPSERPVVDPLPTPDRVFAAADEAERTAIHIDRFGNVVVDLYLPQPPVASGERGFGNGLAAIVGGERVGRWARTFCEIGPGFALLRNSAGYLEIACEGKSAAQRLGLTKGHGVRLIRAGSGSAC